MATPADSGAAQRGPPMQRRCSSGESARMSGPLVLPTSVTTAFADAAASAARTCLTTVRTGAQTKIRSAPAQASSRLAQALVIAPRSSARSSVACVWLKPRTSATPARSRAARPSEPPMRPTPMRATVLTCPSATASDGLARPAREAEDAVRVVAERRCRQGLRPSQSASSGRGCVSTMIPSAPAATAARRSGSTRSRRPAGCDGSTITGRCVSGLSTGMAPMSSVNRVDVSKVLIPRSQRITSELPSLTMYSAAISRSSTVEESPRLSSTGFGRAADLGEEREVRHVAGADLDHVRRVDDRLDVARIHQLGDERQPGLLARLLEDLERLLAEPLERVRRGARLEGAAAEHRHALGRLTARAVSSVCSRVSTVHGPAMKPK